MGNVSIVEALKTAIAESGQSLYQIANLTAAAGSAVSHQQLSRFLRGERDLTLQSAAAVCGVLQLVLKSTKRRGRK